MTAPNLAQIRRRQWRYATAEEAARSLIDAAIADLETLDEDDFAWAKPFVDEALARSERNEVMTLEEHKARSKVRLAAMPK